MIFSLVIYASPFGDQAAKTALRFARSALNKGHKLHRVFFYGDAVLAANSLIAAPQDEIDINAEWQQLAEEHQLDLVVCIAAAVKRGVLNEGEAARYEKLGANLSAKYELSGLGQLAEASLVSDRVITFGA